MQQVLLHPAPRQKCANKIEMRTKIAFEAQPKPAEAA